MLALLVPRTASNCALPPFKAVSTYYAADARTRERKVASWVPHLQRSSSRSRRSPRLPYQPGWANQTQRETPLFDGVCGEVTVTDPTHPLYRQTLPQLDVADESQYSPADGASAHRATPRDSTSSHQSPLCSSGRVACFSLASHPSS